MSIDREDRDVGVEADRTGGAPLWVFVVGGLLLLYALRWVLLPFVIAALIALVTTPLVDRWSNRGRRSRTFYAVIVFFLVLAIFATLGFFGLPPLIGSVERFATGDLETAIGNLVKDTVSGGSLFLGERLDPDRITRTVTEAARKWLEEPSRIAEALGVTVATAFGAFLTLILLIYLLASGPTLIRGALWLVPERSRARVETILQRLAPAVRTYFLGVFFVVIYAAIAAYIGLGLLLGLRHAAPLAVLTGVLEIIPVVGPAASAIIAGLVALSQAKSIGSVLAYAIYATALRLSIDQVMGPLLIGKAAQLHPVVIILGFLIGGALFGVLGALLAIPLALTVKTSVAVTRGEESVETSR